MKKRSQGLGVALEPAIRQVQPGRVACLDQADSSRARPGLDLFLARNGVTHIRKLLEVHQPRSLPNPLLSSGAIGACHPERRRREGSAFVAASTFPGPPRSSFPNSMTLCVLTEP